jgi:hypothetical protein
MASRKPKTLATIFNGDVILHLLDDWTVRVLRDSFPDEQTSAEISGWLRGECKRKGYRDPVRYARDHWRIDKIEVWEKA